MGSWILRWNFDKQFYSPGESALACFWLENTGENSLYLSELELNFDFGKYKLKGISGLIFPRENNFLGNVRLLLPKNVVGIKFFGIKYRMHEYINNNWVDLGFYQSDKRYFISVYPVPFYKVFVSRGLSVDDRAIGDRIVKMISEWGFEAETVGIEIVVPEEQVPQRVKEEIKRADALIAIATPRHMDALREVWITLEWLHNEIGIAFGMDKPLLILKDRRVSLGGLPLYLNKIRQLPIIEFDPNNINELKINLSRCMPDFRIWIETRRGQEFLNTLGTIAVGALAVIGGITIISGIIGTLVGSSKK